MIGVVEETVDDLIDERIDEGVAAQRENPADSATGAGKIGKNGGASHGS